MTFLLIEYSLLELMKTLITSMKVEIYSQTIETQLHVCGKSHAHCFGTTNHTCLEKWIQIWTEF